MIGLQEVASSSPSPRPPTPPFLSRLSPSLLLLIIFFLTSLKRGRERKHIFISPVLQLVG